MPADPSQAQTPDRLLVGVDDGAFLLGVSSSMFRKLHRTGSLPQPCRLGRRVLWNPEELAAWVDAGCPPRDRWQCVRKEVKR